MVVAYFFKNKNRIKLY